MALDLHERLSALSLVHLLDWVHGDAGLGFVGRTVDEQVLGLRSVLEDDIHHRNRWRVGHPNQVWRQQLVAVDLLHTLRVQLGVDALILVVLRQRLVVVLALLWLLGAERVVVHLVRQHRRRFWLDELGCEADVEVLLLDSVNFVFDGVSLHLVLLVERLRVFQSFEVNFVFFG